MHGGRPSLSNPEVCGLQTRSVGPGALCLPVGPTPLLWGEGPLLRPWGYGGRAVPPPAGHPGTSRFLLLSQRCSYRTVAVGPASSTGRARRGISCGRYSIGRGAELRVGSEHVAFVPLPGCTGPGRPSAPWQRSPTQRLPARGCPHP